MGECGRGLGICLEGSLGFGLQRNQSIPGHSPSALLPLIFCIGKALPGARAYLEGVGTINQLGGRAASISFLYSIPFQHTISAYFNEQMGFFPAVTVLVDG